MTRSERRAHVLAWIALAILLPVGLVAAFFSRPSRASVETPPTAAPEPSR